MPSSLRPLGTSLLILAAASCALSAGESTLGPGTWGGDTAILEVVTGGADIEFECAQGRIDGPIPIDRHGEFEVTGTFAPQGPGPSRDDPSSVSKVSYHGRLKGATLTLTVRNGDQEIGSYELTRDRKPILRKCR